MADQKVARMIVEEIGSVAQLEAMLELGHRMTGMAKPGALRDTFGVGCGDNCDAWGVVCGNNCLQGLPHTEEVIRSRFAVDVLGKAGLSSEDMASIAQNFDAVGESVAKLVTKRLDPGVMDKRIAKYGRKK